MAVRSHSFVVIFCLAIFGCSQDSTGPTLFAVSGTVNYKGSPLSGANVTMISPEGHLSTGSTGSDGKFTMTTGGRVGVPLGKIKVGITKISASKANIDVANMKPEDMQKMQIAGKGKAKDLESKSEIPEKYAHPDKSGLTANVDSDASKNHFTFDLVE